MTHGEHPDCGSDYTLREGVAHCPHCGQDLTGYLAEWPHGTEVRRTKSWLRSMKTAGVGRVPVKGRVVGGAVTQFVFVAWSDGTVGAAVSTHIERAES